MDEHIYPAVPIYEEQSRLRRALEGHSHRRGPEGQGARPTGLWNMFMPPHSGVAHVDDTFQFEGVQLTNLEYAPICEMIGRVSASPPRCSTARRPDTGNMEVLNRYGTLEQKERWLRPLMNGEIRSAFLMTEPAVASSDATNIETRIERDGDDYVINGRKWWSSGVGDPRCKVAIVMGKTNPERLAAPAAVADPGAARRARREDPAHAAGVRLRRRPARPRRSGAGKRPRAGGEPRCSAKAAASRSPRRASARAASTTACAPSARPRWRWRRCASG